MTQRQYIQIQREDLNMRRTLIRLRKRIRINHVESTQLQHLLALDEILPTSFEDDEAWFVVPPVVTHVCEDIWVRFDNVVMGGHCGE